MRRTDWKHTGRFFYAGFWMDFSANMFMVAVPYAAMKLGAGSMELGLLGAVRGLTYVVAILSTAVLADRYSRRTITTVSTVALAVVLVLTAWVTTLWQLFAGVLLWAVAVSLFWPSVFAWLGDSHAPEHLGRATGTVNLGWSVGSLIGAALGGVLFHLWGPLPMILAALPALLAGLSMRGAAEVRHSAAEPQAGGKAQPGARRRLASAWLGIGAVCCVFGLMGSVFPKLGSDIGVDASVFGVLYAVSGLTQTVVFGLGFMGVLWTRDWRVSLAAQVLSAALLATVFWATGPWCIVPLYASLGVALAVSYYVSLYVSLEGEGSRGVKSGIHEASLMAGAVIGALAGGTIAREWGLRAPYVPMAALVLLLAAVQLWLNLSSRRAQEKSSA